MPEPLGEILIGTYGLFDSDRQPLKTVAERLSLSYDEAEKLRVKGIRRLRDPRVDLPWHWTQDAFEEEVWQRLSDASHLYVMQGNLAEKVMQRLSGEIALELAMRYGEAGDCLSQIAVTTDKSWARPGYELDEIQDAIALLTGLKERYGLPRPFHTLVALGGKASQLLATAVILSTHIVRGAQYRLHRGYVIDAPTGARSIRIVRLHRLMRHYWPNEPVGTRHLMDAYREHHGDDDLDSSALFVAMRSAPFLFLKTAYHYWTCIHPEAGIQAPPLETDLEFGSIFFKTGLEEVSARTTVTNILREKAPVTDKELIRAMAARSNDRYNHNHLGNVLNNDCGIVYLAPGVLGLEEMAADLCTQERTIEKLLNREDCMCFVAARAVGEPRDLYPLWNGAMEYRWCRWGQYHLSAREFEALLFVIEPEQWPVDRSERERWSENRRSLGRYRPSRQRNYILDRATPTLIHLFRIAIDARTKGDISWVRVNWITRRRLAVPSRACTLLAFLVVLDVLEQVEHWSLRHPAGAKIDAFIDQLNAELYLTGSLQWNSSVGREILETLRESEARTDLRLIADFQIRSFILGIEQEMQTNVGEADHPPPQIDTKASDQGDDIENSGEQAEQLTLF
jgi:hypothetical protein